MDHSAWLVERKRQLHSIWHVGLSACLVMHKGQLHGTRHMACSVSGSGSGPLAEATWHARLRHRPYGTHQMATWHTAHCIFAWEGNSHAVHVLLIPLLPLPFCFPCLPTVKCNCSWLSTRLSPCKSLASKAPGRT
ncbi:hypothetical protein DUNSADRAFT_14224 [Dunaliella salina]|uniref:Encoded protein n=1 Tax=Dunaliella salina TaxID=3046 RepID=A0ABQ7G7Z6_DUNSA|nr:hypothetical protein DUNSADRAFT_14224 [Dunaliella salina]|eukprot:KAF5830659.1 hypothetical protein DUNSADRAFT_14224 [Dunaliella salina]